jgi:hypothetical protein
MQICNFHGARIIGPPRAWDADLDGECGTDVVDTLSGMYTVYSPTAEDTEILVLSPGGVVQCFNHLGRSYVATAPQAIGSGAGVAYGALAVGASPKQAVEAASKYDTRTGGGVESMSVRA